MSDDLRTPFPGQGRPEPDGRPEWVKTTDPMPCPNCGADLVMVTAPVKHPQMRGGRGTATYMGCPACPYASAAVVTARA